MSTVNSTIYEANKNVVACELGEGVAILDLEKDVYYSLNEVGSLAWSKLAGLPCTVDAVVDAVVDGFAIDRDSCAEDVVLLFGQLAEAGLIRPVDGTH